MRLCTQSRYGVRAVFDIAYHSGGAETLVRDISRRQKISPRYLEQIFQKLKKAGILGSKRGPGGGYFLIKKPENITVGEILRVTEGRMNPVPCVDGKLSDRSCERTGKCVTQVIWRGASDRLKEYFNSVTIKKLCKMAKEMGLKRELVQKLTFIEQR